MADLITLVESKKSLSNSQKRVLARLIASDGQEHDNYPTVGLICADTGLDKTTVSKSLGVLVKRSYLAILKPYKGGQGQRNVYGVNFEKLEKSR